jgi:hypothetical protein
MIDLKEPIRGTMVNSRWDNSQECARILINHQELRSDWRKTDLMLLVRSVRVGQPELADMLASFI